MKQVDRLLPETAHSNVAAVQATQRSSRMLSAECFYANANNSAPRFLAVRPIRNAASGDAPIRRRSEGTTIAACLLQRGERTAWTMRQR
jgi:hypothetical protein